MCTRGPCGRSLVPQRLDRVQVRGLDGGIGAEGDADDGANDETQKTPVEGKLGWYFEEIGGGITGGNSEDDADEPADFAQDDSLHNKLHQDIPLLGANRATDTDL